MRGRALCEQSRNECVRTDNGERLRLEVFAISGAFVPFPRIAQSIAQQWQDIGIQLDVSELERNLGMTRMRNNEHQIFMWANDAKLGTRVRFSELFGDKNTLLLYSWMFGPSWDKPCPSCTSLVDGFDRTWYQVTHSGAAFVAIAKAPADRINVWAKKRGWSQIALVSGSDSTYQADYKCQGDSDDMQWPVMHVFRRKDGKIYHFWAISSFCWREHRRRLARVALRLRRNPEGAGYPVLALRRGAPAATG